MHRYHSAIIVEIREQYGTASMQVSHYSLLIGILISNALIAVMFMMSYYRVYYYDDQRAVGDDDD